MPICENINIEKGRTGTIEVVIEDLPVLSEGELLAKLYAVGTMGNTPEMELVGEISSDNSTITFEYDADDTKDLTVKSLNYEIVVYTADKTYIATTTYGLLHIMDSVKIDPTI